MMDTVPVLMIFPLSSIHTNLTENNAVEPHHFDSAPATGRKCCGSCFYHLVYTLQNLKKYAICGSGSCKKSYENPSGSGTQLEISDTYLYRNSYNRLRWS
jgi:hypothetical protein